MYICNHCLKKKHWKPSFSKRKHFYLLQNIQTQNKTHYKHHVSENRKCVHAWKLQIIKGAKQSKAQQRRYQRPKWWKNDIQEQNKEKNRKQSGQGYTNAEVIYTTIIHIPQMMVGKQLNNYNKWNNGLKVVVKQVRHAHTW